MANNSDDFQSDRKPEFVVIVDNLPNNINNEQLRAVFSQYGATKVRAVYRNGQFKGFAGVSFPTLEQAMRAVTEFNHSGAEWGGRKPVCRIASERDLSWFQKKSNNKKQKAKPNQSDGNSNDWLKSLRADTLDIPNQRVLMNEPPSHNVAIKQEQSYPPNPSRQAQNPQQPSFSPPQHSFSPQQHPFSPQAAQQMPQPQNIQLPQNLQQGFSTQQGFPPHAQIPQQNPQQPFFPQQQRYPQQQQQFLQQIPQQFSQHGLLSNPSLHPQVLHKQEFSLDSIMDLVNFQFYFLSFETVIIPQGDVLPREIGIVACTIADGIKKQFEKIIEVHIPEIFLEEANFYKVYHHGIPEHIAEHERSFKAIWDSILDFLRRDTPHQPLVVWTKGPHKQAACLKWLADKAIDSHNMIEVRPVEDVLAYMYRILKIPKMSSSISDIFTPQGALQFPLRCKFHQTKPNFYCALGNAAYIAETFRKEMFPFKLDLMKARSKA